MKEHGRLEAAHLTQGIDDGPEQRCLRLLHCTQAFTALRTAFLELSRIGPASDDCAASSSACSPLTAMSCIACDAIGVSCGKSVSTRR